MEEVCLEIETKKTKHMKNNLINNLVFENKLN